MLDQLVEAGIEVLGVGKIYDIFAGKGLTDTVRTNNNQEGIERLIEREQLGILMDFVSLIWLILIWFMGIGMI